MKTFICVTCKVAKGEDEFEVKKSGNKTSTSRSRKCKSCKVDADRISAAVNPKSFFSRLCTSQRHLHKTGKRKPHNEEWVLTADDLHELYVAQEGRCALSGVLLTYYHDGTGRIDFNASIDRKNPLIGYTKDNVHLVCDRVNTMKHTLNEPMFLWWIKNIYETAFTKDL